VGLQMGLTGLVLLRLHLIRFVVIAISGLPLELRPWLRTSMFSCISRCLPHTQMLQAHL
jgi:hypothetical protein